MKGINRKVQLRGPRDCVYLNVRVRAEPKSTSQRLEIFNLTPHLNHPPPPSRLMYVFVITFGGLLTH